MRFAVVGDLGMFGSEMLNYLRLNNVTALGFNRSNLDLSKGADHLALSLESFDVVINAIAITNVEEAERNPERADMVNGHYAGLLAQASKLTGSLVVQLSTNYVFDCPDSRPIRVNSIPNPVNAYGSSKVLGENLVASSGARYIIFRTAWLYGAHGRNFPNPISLMLRNSGPVSIVDDQFGQPTWTKDLASVVFEHCVSSFGEELVHAVSSGSASWFEFAEAVWLASGRIDKTTISPIASSDFSSAVARPRNCVLDNSKTNGPKIGHWLARWKIAAPEVLNSVQKPL